MIKTTDIINYLRAKAFTNNPNATEQVLMDFYEKNKNNLQRNIKDYTVAQKKLADIAKNLEFVRKHYFNDDQNVSEKELNIFYRNNHAEVEEKKNPAAVKKEAARIKSEKNAKKIKEENKEFAKRRYFADEEVSDEELEIFVSKNLTKITNNILEEKKRAKEIKQLIIEENIDQTLSHDEQMRLAQLVIEKRKEESRIKTQELINRHK